MTGNNQLQLKTCSQKKEKKNTLANILSIVRIWSISIAMCNQLRISIKDKIVKSRLMSRTSTKPKSTDQKYRWLLKANRTISPAKCYTNPKQSR